MAAGFLDRLRHKTHQATIGHALYNWSLGSGATPRSFLCGLSDGWGGDIEKGRMICTGRFEYDSGILRIDDALWTEDISKYWRISLHGFDWLRHLKQLGGETARLQARSMIESWMRHFSHCHPHYWQVDITGLRLASWIAFYDFFGESAGDGFQERFFASLLKQAKHLSRSLNACSDSAMAFESARGLIFAGLALQNRESWLEQGLDHMQALAEKQILSDGGHISRSPAQLLDCLRIFIDVRAALKCGGYPPPAAFEKQIEKMAQALRFFRYADKRLSVFHGTQEGDARYLDMVLSRSNARGKVLRSLPKSGFERMVLGRSLVMMDCGAPPPFPFDDAAHASPLAFEFIYGKERVFSSCGTHFYDRDWRDSLRATAAHNSLTIDHRNSGEIKEDEHFGRRPRKVMVSRVENADQALIEATHDGYVPLNGITHRRRIYISSGGHDLRGEDMVTSSVGMNKAMDITVRFHLHPRVLVSLIQDGSEALLRLPGGAGWRFLHNGGALSLENSLYLADGVRPRKTKQLVISGVMDSDSALIKWGLQREGR